MTRKSIPARQSRLDPEKRRRVIIAAQATLDRMAASDAGYDAATVILPDGSQLTLTPTHKSSKEPTS
jgi:hypothetical protein